MYRATSTYALREFIKPPPDARNRVLELENVHVPDLSARSTIFNTLEARLSYFFTQTGFLAAKFARKILYNLVSPTSSRLRISAILPPGYKGPSADVYDGMTLVASYSSRTPCAQLKKCDGRFCSWNGNSKGATKCKGIICDGRLYSW